MIWSCVEERVIIKRDNGQTYGRMVRRIVFGDIFADKMAVLSRNPIPIIAHRHLNVRVNKNKQQKQLPRFYTKCDTNF